MVFNCQMILSLGHRGLDHHIQSQSSLTHQYILAHIGAHHIMIRLDDLLSITDIDTIDKANITIINLLDILDNHTQNNDNQSVAATNPKFLICGYKMDDTKTFAFYVDSVADMVDVGVHVKPTNIAIDKTNVLHHHLYNAPFMFIDDDSNEGIIWDISALIGLATSYVAMRDHQDIIAPFKTPVHFICTLLDFFTDFCLTTQDNSNILYTDLVMNDDKDDKRVYHFLQYYLYHEEIHPDLPDITYYMKPRDQAGIYMVSLPLKQHINNTDVVLEWRIFFKAQSDYIELQPTIDKTHKQFLTLFQ